MEFLATGVQKLKPKQTERPNWNYYLVANTYGKDWLVCGGPSYHHFISHAIHFMWLNQGFFFFIVELSCGIFMAT